MVGMTTNVAQSVGTPAEKSSLASVLGGTAVVTSRFTKPTDTSDAGRTTTTTIRTDSHPPAVAVTGGKILETEDARRVAAEPSRDEAGRFVKHRPVDGREQPQAGHTVADADDVRSLPLPFVA